MIILDTSFVSLLHSGNNTAREKLAACPDPDVRISIIAKCEMLRGRLEFLLKASNEKQFLLAQDLLLLTEQRLAEANFVASGFRQRQCV